MNKSYKKNFEKKEERLSTAMYSGELKIFFIISYIFKLITSVNDYITPDHEEQFKKVWSYTSI